MLPKIKTAPKWRFLLARMFGKRIVASGIVAYQFRGATYVVEMP